MSLFLTDLDGEISIQSRIEGAAAFVLASLEGASSQVALPDTAVAALLFVPEIESPLTATRAALASGATRYVARSTLADSLAGWPEFVEESLLNENETFRFVVEELTPGLRSASDLTGVFPLMRLWTTGDLSGTRPVRQVAISPSRELNNLIAERLFNARLTLEDYEDLRPRAARLRDSIEESL